MATVTFFHAHPDDEAIISGGTMASLAAQGHRVVLVTATRGELGEVADGYLAPDETLGERREVELARAAAVLGVARLEFLGYYDSGMEGEDSNRRPDSFAAADRAEAAGRLAAILVEEASDVLVVYDEHGGYGHPDHVQVHDVGVAAAGVAATPVLYLCTMDRGFMLELRRRAAESGSGPDESELEGADTMGEPSARITTEVDVRPWTADKRAAMRAHASQIDEESFFLSMDEDLFTEVWGHEWFIRISPEPVGLGDGVREDGLLVTADGTLAGGAARDRAAR